jgi:hypothetical protein
VAPGGGALLEQALGQGLDERRHELGGKDDPQLRREIVGRQTLLTVGKNAPNSSTTSFPPLRTLTRFA